jgi:hypothetical protein
MRALNPRLPAERTAVDHQHAEALRGCIDGGCESRGPGTRDGDVVQRIFVNRIEHANAARELAFARVAENFAIGAYRQRQLVRRGCVAANERLCFGVGCRVEQPVRYGVAAEKAGQASDVR